jgi:hypothetical protein
MTNTDTADASGTALQVADLARAGSLLVRVTVNNDAAARAVPEIASRLADMGVAIPVIGDFHYNGHLLLVKYPETAKTLAKYRINPGNVGGKRRDENFRTIIQVALDNDKPVRIGVNWGSLDQDLLTTLMDDNARSSEPRAAKEVYIEAMIQSALRSAFVAEEMGLSHDRIIISAKVSGVQDLLEVYRLGAITRCTSVSQKLGSAQKASSPALPRYRSCSPKELATRFAYPSPRVPAGIAPKKSASRSKFFSRSSCKASIRRSRRVRDVVALRLRSFSTWRRIFSPICASRCRRGASSTPA